MKLFFGIYLFVLFLGAVNYGIAILFDGIEWVILITAFSYFVRYFSKGDIVNSDELREFTFWVFIFFYGLNFMISMEFYS